MPLLEELPRSSRLAGGVTIQRGNGGRTKRGRKRVTSLHQSSTLHKGEFQTSFLWRGSLSNFYACCLQVLSECGRAAL